MSVANDNWMGLWINGMPEAGVLLLMKQKVPCFIVHEFPLETPVLHSAVPRPPTFFSFVEGTNVVYLVRNNTYQLLAESQGRPDSLFRAEDGRGEHVPTDPRNEERSSSIYMTSCPPWVPRPRPQVARMTVGGGGARTASGALVTSAAPGARRVARGGGARSASGALISAAPVESEEEDESEEDEESGEDSAPVFRIPSLPVYMLPTPAASNDHWERFGSPVPRYPFFIESGNRWTPKKLSHWMCPSQDGEARDFDKRAEAPHPSRLPHVEGKGKTLVVEDLEMEDKGLLSSDEEEGMEVDKFEEENPATNVVTLADTNQDISVQTFQALTRDAFSISHAHPLAILRAQGLIWVCFEDVTAGRRGFGVLGAVWKKMQIGFRPNGEFDKAALYTTDVWLREEDFDEDTPAPPYAPAVTTEQEVANVHLPTQPAVSASQAASATATEREVVNPTPSIQPAVSASQAAPEWGGLLELDWDAVSGSQATAPSPRETASGISGETASVSVAQQDSEQVEVRMSPPLAESEEEPSILPQVKEQPRQEEHVVTPPRLNTHPRVATATAGGYRPLPRLLPTEPRAMRNKGKGVVQPTLGERLSTPYPTRPESSRLPSESRLTNPTPSLAERLSRVSPPSLLDRMLPPPPPSNVAGPSSSQGLTNSTPPRGPRKLKKASGSLAGLLATRPDPSAIPSHFAVLLNRKTSQQDGRQTSRRWTVTEEGEEGSSNMTPEGDRRQEAEWETLTEETPEVEMPDAEMEELPLFALHVAASSGILHLVGRGESPEDQELPDAVQDNDNDEMADAPQRWTAEDDDDDLGMGPH
ncbi:hypothetical protein DFH08DRAFT_969698 [Mycena albidolilacea]|uniref:Uncharacterized protein n=1 Tax=Mycena albidolilacea TaxID=1033008 RepID=A0AAD6ZGW5_9AGAR|nr:hypothetical protein DFH08DRAFT_969698 [Mycena albidolilacea]